MNLPLDMRTAAFRLLLFVLVFAPLAFGTVEPWSLAIMEIAMLSGLVLYLWQPLPENTGYYAVPGLLPLLLLLGYIGVQLLPLPAGLVKLVAPSIHALYAETLGVLEPRAWITLSIQPKSTLAELFRYASYVACFILTVQLLADQHRLRSAVRLLLVFSALLALYAILQKILAAPRIYWFREVPANSTMFGSYVYHNHFAGFMEMVVPLTVALFFHYRPRVSYKRTWRQRLASLLNQHRTNLHVLLGFGGLLMLTSVFMSLSRGGITSLCISLLFLLILQRKRYVGQQNMVLAGAFFIVVVLAVGWFGWDAVFQRFADMRDIQGELHDGRLIIWHDSVQILRDFMTTGTGLGTFDSIYPAYRTLPGGLLVTHAHNDYLELLTDSGLIGFVLVIWFWSAVLIKSYRLFQHRRDPFAISLFYGALCGMLALIVHSVTDFNFQSGANGLLFFFLAGLAVSAAHVRFQPGLGSRLVQSRPRVMIVRMVSLLVLLATIWFHFGVLVGANRFMAIEPTLLNRATSAVELQQVRRIATAASRLDPLEAQYRFARANADMLLGNSAAGRQQLVRTVQYDPTNAGYLQSAGLIMSGQGDDAISDGLLRAGIRFDAANPERYGRYGSWLLAAGRKQQGLAAIQRAIELAPNTTDGYIGIMLLYGLDDGDIRQALPFRPEPYLRFAAYLQSVGQEAMAENAYNDALGSMASEPGLRAVTVYRIYRYYLGQGRKEDALAVMVKGVELLPRNIGLRLTAARLYEQVGIPYRAVEEYERVLALDASNRTARKRLAKLKPER